MERATRDKFAARTNDDLTSGNSCLETPRPLFDRINEELGPFDLDLCGDPARHHLPRWLGPGSPLEEFDALEAFWPAYGRRGFANPPYGPFVQRLMEWARQMASAGCSSALLLPLRITRAMKEHVIAPAPGDPAGAAALIFCDRRIPFLENGLPRLNEAAWVREGKARADGALFDSVIVCFEAGHRGPARLGVLEVPECVTKEDLERAAELRRAQDLAKL